MNEPTSRDFEFANRNRTIPIPPPAPTSYGANQADPTGRDQHEAGAKLDSGKLRASLVLGGFATALKSVAAVGTMGAEKYTPNGWKTVPEGIARYKDALWRHLLAYEDGEFYDAESGLPHLAHLGWNVLAILTLELRRNMAKMRIPE